MSLGRPRRTEEKADRELDYTALISEASDGSLMEVRWQLAKNKFCHGNKSFIIKGRGSSVVEQPIRKP